MTSAIARGSRAALAPTARERNLQECVGASKLGSDLSLVRLSKEDVNSLPQLGLPSAVEKASANMFPFLPARDQPLLASGGTFIEVPDREASERTRHRNVIARLADELDRPEAEIALLYDDILTDLRRRARISDYLPILVSKRVKTLLKN